MKKNILLFFLSFIIILFFMSDSSYAVSATQGTKSVDLRTETIEKEDGSTDSTIKAVPNSEINGSMRQNGSEVASQSVVRAATQDTDGFWLVDSAAALTEYLKDSTKLHFRLTNNINLGSTGFEFKDGTIFDGAGYIVTYNKAGNANQGFYANQANAVIEIRNTQFGNADGSGAVGYYGFLTGLSAVNMTFIFDNIKYFSNNGQMIYNLHGSIIMRGENEIEQLGTGTYSQEWAETNYVEIQSGHTTIKHSSNSTLAFIWSQSVSSGNPYANSSKIIVKENTKLDIQTNANMTYGTLRPSYIVEKNGTFNLDKVTLATGGDRNKFFNSSLIGTIVFDFQENAHVAFHLPSAINLGSAGGGFSVGKGAEVLVDVPSASIFSANTTSQFILDLNNPETASFSSNYLGTLALNSQANSTFGNLIFQHQEGLRIDTYNNRTDPEPTTTFYKDNAIVNVSKANFKNTPQSVEQLEQAELNALMASRKLVFSRRIDPPSDVYVSVDNVTATSADFGATSDNNGSQATEVKFLIFSSEADVGQLTKARHIINVTEFDEHNTQRESSYVSNISELNPNTTYWVQTIVTNKAGQSEFSAAQRFSTLPALESISVENSDVTKATIKGTLQSDTGKWTDFTNGEANAVPDNPVTYGGDYQKVQVEYSTDKTFPAAKTMSKQAELSGEKKQYFSANITKLASGTTYFVRIKVTGISGEEVILSSTPLTEFRTIDEIIDVEVPLDMVFQTRNKDINTTNEGKIYSKQYQITNKSNVSIEVSLTDLSKENAAAEQLKLLNTLTGTADSDSLALQLLVDNNVSEAKFITNDLTATPIIIGDLDTSEHTKTLLTFGGKYFNAAKKAISPAYKTTFKFERITE